MWGLTTEQRYALDDRREMENHEHCEHFYTSDYGDCCFCNEFNDDLRYSGNEEDEMEVC